MKRRNWESDFVAKMKLPKGLEGIDFEAIFTTNGIKEYVVSRKNGELRNCVVNDDGDLIVIFKNHGLRPGMLKVKFISWLDGINEEIGKLKNVMPRMEDVELVVGAGDDCGELNFEIAVDYAVVDAYDMAVANGYRGSYADYLKFITGKIKSDFCEYTLLHRRCISWNSKSGEVYSGPYLKIPAKVGISYVNDIFVDRESGENNGVAYVIEGDKLTITENPAEERNLLFELKLENSPHVKWSVDRKLVGGIFNCAVRVDSRPIGCGELRDSLAIQQGTSENPKLKRVAGCGLEIEIRKSVRSCRAAERAIKKKKWIAITTGCKRANGREIGDGIALSRSLMNGRCYKFILRARRNGVGEWHYYSCFVSLDECILQVNREIKWDQDFNIPTQYVVDGSITGRNYKGLITENKTIVGAVNEVVTETNTLTTTVNAIKIPTAIIYGKGVKYGVQRNNSIKNTTRYSTKISDSIIGGYGYSDSGFFSNQKTVPNGNPIQRIKIFEAVPGANVLVKLFNGCHEIKEIDFSEFAWSASPGSLSFDISGMFGDNLKLTKLTGLDAILEDILVCKMDYFMLNCDNLEEIILPNLTCSLRGYAMDKTISNTDGLGSKLRVIDFRNWNFKTPPGIFDWTSPFIYNHKNLEEVNLENWNMEVFTGNAQFFIGACPKLKTLKLPIGKIQFNIPLGFAPELSDESLNGVIEALYDFRSNGDTTTSKVLTLSSVCKAKLSESDTARIVAKGWTLA